MKKIKFKLTTEPMNFGYNDKIYELKIVNVDRIDILKGFQIPATEAIRIRKTDKEDESITDYYIFRHYGRNSAYYFCLGGKDYIRFKYDPAIPKTVHVTLYPNKTERLSDHALRISVKQTPDGPVSCFGIRSVDDPVNKGKINSRQLFAFDGKDFKLNIKTTQDKILYEFYEQVVCNIIDMLRSITINPQIADKRVLPYRIDVCSAKASPVRVPQNRKFFHGNYINTIAEEPPTFITELLENAENEYCAITLECRILGELTMQRIDCYIFAGSPQKLHQVTHQDGIQFIHFKDYYYHLRYETGPFCKKSVIKLFESSQEILRLEQGYIANVENHLEGLPITAKKQIIEAMVKIH